MSPRCHFLRIASKQPKASEEWGIFQLTDHGISPELFRRLKEAGEGFFSLPQEYKEQYANDFAGGVFEGYGTKLAKNPVQKLEWIDYFFHFMWPTSRVNYDKWPKSPPNYREVRGVRGRNEKGCGGGYGGSVGGVGTGSRGFERSIGW
ncbi:flavonol synthase/flavanone 3-hydroxylase [Amborella trichopoda]|uniref:flavonol synthase/flavanone 3-hydroxylase n=1 Tax=Amborella trichopoda TaxID=13333 RepID=UPI0009BCC6DD|nr:flavonol synthase/flavanone 3-hydroxylase [Amborella trichopoda]|eukprot:XP_020517641.1 flavonol synthase/flavanone 3-hydroxylase [Amborella trichopoda]